MAIRLHPKSAHFGYDCSMETWKEYHGRYYFTGVLIEVQERGDQLVASMPDIPAGYEIVLEPLGADRFRMRGGPLDGSAVTFGRDGNGQVQAVQAGDFEMARLPDGDMAGLEMVERVPSPDFDLDADQAAAFQALLAGLLEQADGRWIEYELPYPKHTFLQYCMQQERFIFHGSKNLQIEVFSPVRKSVELRDRSGRGNIQAVYGTHDALWAMFFAIVDREKLQGSIRNGVTYFKNRVGEERAFYHFSVNREQLAEKPWSPGALYFLPRETFVRIPLTPETPSNEWASQVEVKPLAKIQLEPQDFPFLDQIGGHDDSQLLELAEISRALREQATAARLQGDRFQVTLPHAAEWTGRLDRFVELQAIFMPAAHYSYEKRGGEIVLTVSSLPPALKQVLTDSYQELLQAE